MSSPVEMDADHVAIGSDLDGGFGEEDVAKAMHGNWLRFMRTHLPAE